MEEQAVKGAGQLINYGALGIFCLILLAGFTLAAMLIRKNYEQQLKEKDKNIERLEKEIIAIRKEWADYRDKREQRLNDTIDHCADAIQENSKALYEVGSVVSENKGVLLSIHELMKNR